MGATVECNKIPTMKMRAKEKLYTFIKIRSYLTVKRGGSF